MHFNSATIFGLLHFYSFFNQIKLAGTKKRLPVIFCRRHRRQEPLSRASWKNKFPFSATLASLLKSLPHMRKSRGRRRTQLRQHVVRYCTRLKQNISFALKMSVFYCLWLCLFVADAFNLEPRLPVFKLGEKGSYFGYSVAEHQILDSRTSSREPV